MATVRSIILCLILVAATAFALDVYDTSRPYQWVDSGNGVDFYFEYVSGAASDYTADSIIIWEVNTDAETWDDTSELGGNDGTRGAGANQPTHMTNAGNGYYYYDGGDLGFIADAAQFSFGNGTTDRPFSMSAWVNPTNLVALGTVMGKWAGGGYEYILYVGSSEQLNFAVYSRLGDSAYLVTRTTAALPINTWTHVAATYDGASIIGGMKLYTNGVAAALTPGGAGTYIAMSNGAAYLSVGRAQGGLGIVGSIDSSRLYTNELSLTQVQQIYDYSKDLY